MNLTPTRRLQIFVSLFILTLVLVIYWQTRKFPFVLLDDNFYITENPHIYSGWSWNNLKWALTDTAASGFWQPMVWLSFLLDSHLYSMDPGGFHITNGIIHTLNSILLFSIFFIMSGAPILSTAIAVFFAIHPQHVESVAWVTERKDLLSALFGFSSIYLYISYIKNRKTKNLVGSLITFALGLASKAMIVTLPVLLLLLDYWPLCRLNRISFKKTLQEKIPYIGLSFVFSLLTLFTNRFPLSQNDLLGWKYKVGTAITSYGLYLYKMFWPLKLSVLYTTPAGPTLSRVVISALSLVGISSFVYWRRKQSPWLTVGWLWYLISLIPVIGLVPVGSQSMADRFTYIPSVGISMMILWGGKEVWIKSLLIRKMFQFKILRGALALVLLSFWVGLSWKQTSYWQNTETLFKHSLEVAPGSYVLHNNLGNILANQGRYDEAISEYLASLAIKPSDSFPHDNLGLLYTRKGNYPEAVKHFNEGLRLEPKDALIHNNYGLLLSQQGKTAEALVQYQEATKLRPDLGPAHLNLGATYALLGKTSEAIEEYQEGLKYLPQNSNAHTLLGVIYQQQGQREAAKSQYENAIRFDPGNSRAHFNLGTLLAMEGKNQSAIEHLKNAVSGGMSLDINAHYNLGLAYYSNGNLDEAQKEIETLSKLDSATSQRLASQVIVPKK